MSGARRVARPIQDPPKGDQIEQLTSRPDMSSSTDPYEATTGSRTIAPRDVDRRVERETKPSFKTTELIIYLLAVIGVLIASWWSTSTRMDNGSAPTTAGSS